jgi:hypothetical protein
MGTVINFPRHHWHTCQSDRCFICDGGLAACIRCNTSEGTLPTDCPGTHISWEDAERIYNGKLDYRFGRGWIEASSSTWDHNVKPYGRRIKCT